MPIFEFPIPLEDTPRNRTLISFAEEMLYPKIEPVRQKIDNGIGNVFQHSIHATFASNRLVSFFVRIKNLV